MKNEGTTFTIRLPRRYPSIAPSALAPSGSGEMTRTKRKILFFDSDPANLSAYDESFGRMHDVLLAETPDQALEVLDQQYDTLDALVSELPVQESTRAKYILDMKRWPQLQRRFIFIGEPGDALDDAQKQGYRVLEKPVRLAVLLGEIYKLPTKNHE